MRKWFFIAIAALIAYGCNREMEPEPEKTDPEGRVEVSFTVLGDQIPTKALGESEDLKTIGVAIFGGSGYLKEYQTVIPSFKDLYTYHYKDKDGVERTKDVPRYTCTISLPLTNSKRRVHLIGNGPVSIPFGRDTEVLPNLLSETATTGFWQAVLLDNITARTAKTDNGEEYYVYPDDDTNRARQDGEPYVASSELKAAFKDIGLIRNWAKIELSATEDCNFTPYSFAVVNVPTKGTLVPYGGTKGFIYNYKDLSFDELRSKEYDYSGHLPSSVPFDSSVPSEEAFKNPADYPESGVKTYSPNTSNADDEDHTVYLYERPIPDGTIPPTYVIVYGLYKNSKDTSLSAEEKENGVECYYKVDLMSGSEYYPVLRNFRYQISIEKISVRGHDTPAEAAAAAGSADVSADVNASHLPDISDGTRRMAIEPWMSKTYIKAQKDSIFVTFYDDINGVDPVPNMKEECVWCELTPETAGIIKNVEIHKPVDLPEGFNPDTDQKPSNYGWRTITYDIASPGEARARTQTLRVLCKTDPTEVDETPLYRDIVISLLPTQTMHVSCETSRILRATGQKVRVDVAIPDGLVESMFPLAFNIEAKELSLTADNTETEHVMPVLSGPSLSNSSKNTFYFQRTVTWSEYKSLSSKLDFEDESRWRTFSSYFMTNRDESATKIYVGNSFFYTGETQFENYESFNNPRFTSSIPFAEGSPVTVSASMISQSASYSETVLLDLKNLKPADDSWKPEASGKYAFHPTSQDMVFNLVTTSKGGDVSVTLTTDDGVYEPVTLVPWHFTNVGFADGMIMPGSTSMSTYSHVVWGNVDGAGGSYKLLFGYSTDSANKHPFVRLIDNGGGLNIPNDYKSEKGKETSKQHTNTYAGQDNYHWAELHTDSGSFEDVSLTLSAVGYVEQPVYAGRFNGGLYSLTLSTNNTSGTNVSWEKFVSNGLECNLDLTQRQIKGNFSLKLTSIDPEKVPVQHEAGILLPKGGHYRWDAQVSSDNNDVYPYFVQITYYDDGASLMRPRSAEPGQDDSNYFMYPGDYTEYVWDLSNRQTGGSLVMNAYSDKDIVITRIILRGFHGVVYDSANNGGGDIGFGDDLKDGGKL